MDQFIAGRLKTKRKKKGGVTELLRNMTAKEDASRFPQLVSREQLGPLFLHCVSCSLKKNHRTRPKKHS